MKYFNGHEHGARIANGNQWRNALIVARASLATKARRKSAAPIPANGLRGDPSMRENDLVPDPSFLIASGRRPTINVQPPTEDTTKSHKGCEHLEMRRTNVFVIV